MGKTKGFNPTIEVSVFEMMRTKPGDRCPDTDCPGIIMEIRFSWTKDSFTGDAVCSHCKESWCVAEQPSYGDVMEAEYDDDDVQT